MANTVNKERVYAIKDHIRRTSKYSIRSYLQELGKWSGEETASGNNVKVHCPFHKDKTPSCYVNDTDKIWNCFSCGRHGDYIALVSEVSKVIMGNQAGYYQTVNNILLSDQAMQLMLGFSSIYTDKKQDFTKDFRRRRFVMSKKWIIESYPELATVMQSEGLDTIENVKLAILHMQDGIPPQQVYNYVTGLREAEEDNRGIAFSEMNFMDILGGDDDGEY